MAPQPALRTERLLLRPFRLEDAAVVQLLAGAREVADTALTIPHPYLDGMAESWIGTHADAWDRQEAAALAITTEADGVIGAISFHLEPAHRRAELGIAFGFDALALNRIHAAHLTRNPASGRVLVKAGMRFEGILRQHVIKWDRPEDVAVYAVLGSG